MRTVAEVLKCFETDFAEFATAFPHGEYLLWVGSGVSRDVVPNVPHLLTRLLEFLQSNIDVADPSCRFKKAIEQVLSMARAGDSVDLTVRVRDWPNLEDIVERLGDKYSDALDVQISGETEPDFLVWNGLEVPRTYGAPTLEPTVEHFCIAVLMLEGVVRSVPTTNWDGLVEAAMRQLVSDADSVMRVIIQPQDFRAADRRADLVKFHGCAVHAVVDEGTYRDLLVARRSQISGWASKRENQLMKNHLSNLFASRPALVLGLSAQDANIHTVLHEATNNLERQWPCSPPAVVFAEETLHEHHRHVMHVTYGDQGYAANSGEIEGSALLGAYARPVLVALVLFTLFDKLCALLRAVPELGLSDSDLNRLVGHLRTIQNVLGEFADLDPRSLVDAVVSASSLTLPVFRTGHAPNGRKDHYQPISVEPIARSMTNLDFPSAAFGRLAVAVSLLARGFEERDWTLRVGNPARVIEGVLQVTTPRQLSRLFFVRDAHGLSALEVDGNIDLRDDATVVIQAESAAPVRTRSPRTRFGRSGATGFRRLDLESLCVVGRSADDLFEGFKLGAVL